MPYGWTGLDLEVDLSAGNVVRTESDRRISEAFLGGRGIGTKMAWDRIPPEVEPLSPRNPLIINPGTLTGTICPGANRTAITTRSPQNNLLTYSLMGGFFGPELKFAGYDSLVVSGCAEQPVYIWIQDGKVEIRDARHIWGRDTFDTQSIVRHELDCEDAQVMCIGPAGENKAMCASIEHGTGASASRSSIAAVMGVKKLKAIAVRGSKDLSIAKPQELVRLCDDLVMNARDLKKWHDDIAYTHIAADLAKFFYAGRKDLDVAAQELGDLLDRFLVDFRTKRPGCFNCPASCRSTVRLPDGSVSHGKCGAYHQFCVAFKLDDYADSWRVYEVVERMGLDINSVVPLGKFAIELFQRGILTSADTDGLVLEYGKVDVVITLMQQMARREGIGDVLAKGIYDAAREIGRGAEAIGDHVKKLETRITIPYQQPYVAYATAMSDRGDVSRAISYVPHHLLKKDAEVRAKFVASRYWGYPEEWKSIGLDTADKVWRDPQRISMIMSRDRDEVNLADTAGLCSYWTCRRPSSPIKVSHIAGMISAATGLDLDEAEALKCAARSGDVMRAYNTILGIRRRDDAPPERVFHEGDGALPPLDRALFDSVMGEYYRLRGWDDDGVPTGEGLRCLGLDYVAEELGRRGIDGITVGREGVAAGQITT